MMFRAIAVMVVVLAAAISDSKLGIAAALVYALAYTAELGLSLVSYYTGPRREGLPSEAPAARAHDVRARRCPRARSRVETFDPTTEFEQHEWIPIHLGPLNLSITKAVVYLMLGTAAARSRSATSSCATGRNEPGRRATVGETVYEIAQVQVAEQGLPTKAIGRWFPTSPR